MMDPSLTDEQQAKLIPKKVWLGPDNDDDDDDDAYDSDDDETPAPLLREPWLARPDFGSPEWWSRT